MKMKQEEEPRGGRTTTKSVPMESKKPTGISNAVRGREQQRVRCSAKRWPPEASDVEMGAEDLCEPKVKRAKTIVGLEICVLEAQDEVYDAPGTPTNRAETSGEKATDEDVVAPELGRAHKAPSVDELMPLRLVYSQKTNERLDDRKVAEGRQLTMLHVF